jgi:CRISPR-associated protein Cas1
VIALYLTEPGSVLRREGETFVVTHDVDPDGSGPLPEARRTLLEIEPHKVSWIALLGGVHLTRAAATLTLDRGIPVAWLSASGRFLGRLTPARDGGAEGRLAQYAAATDPERALEVSRAIVTGKLANAAALLRLLQSNRPGVAALGAAHTEISTIAERARSAPDGDALRGHEGAGTRAYFAGYGAAFSGAIGFAGRARRPPPDPANALLSFCYALLASRLSGMVQARGLDPTIGFHHGLRPGRESLVLDLMEEFRHPLVDRFVLRLCNLRMVKPDDFEPDPDRPGGLRLILPALRRVLAEWEKQLRRPLRGGADAPAALQLLARQVDRLAAALVHGGDYDPFALAGDDGVMDALEAAGFDPPAEDELEEAGTDISSGKGKG